MDTILMPRNLEATVEGYNVTLSWEPSELTGGMFSHSPAQNWVSASGFDTNPFIAAHRYTPQQLANFGVAGATLSQVSFIPFTEQATAPPSYTLMVWVGGSQNGIVFDEGELVLSQPVTQTLTSRAWITITLSTPIPIPLDREVWIGFAMTNPGNGHPMSHDNGPSAHGTGYGDLVNVNGEGWFTMSMPPNLANINHQIR